MASYVARRHGARLLRPRSGATLRAVAPRSGAVFPAAHAKSEEPRDVQPHDPSRLIRTGARGELPAMVISGARVDDQSRVALSTGEGSNGSATGVLGFAGVATAVRSPCVGSGHRRRRRRARCVDRRCAADAFRRESAQVPLCLRPEEGLARERGRSQHPARLLRQGCEALQDTADVSAEARTGGACGAGRTCGARGSGRRNGCRGYRRCGGCEGR